MKKQLLFTIAFLGVIIFASAQTNTITFDQSGSDEQTFTVGQQATDDLNDVNIVAVSGTGATVASNNSFFGINSPITSSDVAGTFTFIVTTDSATAIDTPLTLDMAKRQGCSISGKVSVTGYPDINFSQGSNGSDANPVEPIVIEFGSIISLVAGAPLTVTITLDEILSIDNTANAIFRLENVILEKGASLGIEETNLANRISLFPNPVKDSFQLSSIKDIKNVQIYGITGSLLKTFKTNANYDISDLAAGIYMANINTQSGSKTLKIVKK